MLTLAGLLVQWKLASHTFVAEQNNISLTPSKWPKYCQNNYLLMVPRSTKNLLNAEQATYRREIYSIFVGL